MLFVLMEEEIKHEAAKEKEIVEIKGKVRSQEGWKGT